MVATVSRSTRTAVMRCVTVLGRRSTVVCGVVVVRRATMVIFMAVVSSTNPASHTG